MKKKFNPKSEALQRTKSVSIPHVDNAILLQNSSRDIRLVNHFTDVAHSYISEGSRVGWLMLIQLLSGCRISEALSIKGIQLSLPYTIQIIASKNSDNRIISSTELRAFVERYAGLNVPLFADYNYIFIYRLYKRLGMSIQGSYGMKAAVTHLPRVLNATNNFAQLKDIDTIKHSLGHKSVKSTQIYVNKERK